MKVITSADLLTYEKQFRTNLVNCLTGFHSANLIGTHNLTTNVSNLGIFSSCIHIGSNPAYLGFMMRPVGKDIKGRDTYHNLTNETNPNPYFTVNHIHFNNNEYDTQSIEFLSKAHQTAARYESNICEFEACDLEKEWNDQFKFVPFVKESKLKIGCKFIEECPITCNNTKLLIGQIELIVIDNSVTLSDDGFIDLESFNNIAISGLDTYHATNKIVSFEYSKPDLPIKQKLR